MNSPRSHRESIRAFTLAELIVAVAAFNLVSTLVMTVTDKRADIAILRTLGASPKSIMGVFVVQGAMVGVIGTLGGLGLGLLIAYNIDLVRVLPNVWKKNMRAPRDKDQSRGRATAIPVVSQRGVENLGWA